MDYCLWITVCALSRYGPPFYGAGGVHQHCLLSFHTWWTATLSVGIAGCQVGRQVQAGRSPWRIKEDQQGLAGDGHRGEDLVLLHLEVETDEGFSPGSTGSSSQKT